ncbi:MAG TPA: hypothetical protein VL588_06980 [Bdellovibrionota bacterium]|nr:hypothetical protein [Bdellovibrionota bacterium]
MRRLPFALAFVVAPLLVGTVFMVSVFLELLVRNPPPPLDASAPRPTAVWAGSQDPAGPMAIVWIPASGAQLTELALAWQTVAATGRYRMMAVAESDGVQRTSSSVGLLAHTTLARAPHPSLLILPSHLGIITEVERNWIAQAAGQARTVLALGTAVGALLESGAPPKDLEITTHFLARRSVEPHYPGARWNWDHPWIRRGKWVTGWGLLRTPDATAAALAADLAPKGAAVPDAEGPPAEGDPPARGFSLSEWASLWLNGGFGWGRENVGVVLQPGVSDVGVAALLDVWPRSMGIRVVTLSDKRYPVVGRTGLIWVPAIATAQSPGLDRLLVPGGASPLQAGGRRAEPWGPVDPPSTGPGPGAEAYRQALAELRVRRGSVSHWVEHVLLSPFLGLPETHFPNGAEWHFLLRALGVALLGMAYVRLLRRREWSKPRSPQPLNERSLP